MIVASVSSDNMSAPLTWQWGDDRRLVSTTATTGWEQLAPDLLRFQSHQGVKFHNGDAWNALAALPELYAVNPKLVREPRFDRRVRINDMFSRQ